MKTPWLIAAASAAAVVFGAPAFAGQWSGNVRAGQRSGTSGASRETRPAGSSGGSTSSSGSATGSQGETQGADAQQGEGADAADLSAAEHRGPRVMALTQESMQAVADADAALGRGDRQTAMKLLDQAARGMRAVYVGAPGAQLAQRMDALSRTLQQQQEGGGSGTGSGTGSSGSGSERSGSESGSAMGSSGGSDAQGSGTGLAPVFADVHREAIYLDPGVVAGVRQAEQQMSQGNRQGAADQLRLARERLVGDVGLVPVEDAYARIVAARSELQQGDEDSARRLLQGIPVLVEQIDARAPLVPARFDLRAAAAAAESGNWDHARELLRSATDRLQALESSAEPGTARELQPILNQARQLEQRLESGNQPSAGELRNLAQRTTEIGTG